MASSNWPKDVVLEPKETATGVVIMSHGLGDTADGWTDSMEMLAKRLSHVRFILPTAPHQPVSINGGMRMPSWYDIYDLSGDGREDPEGCGNSRDRIHKIINDEIEKGIPADRIVVAGFSQGGAMALYSGLSFDKKLAGIVALSCYIPVVSQFPDAIADANKETKVLMCHGDADQVVSYEWGKGSADLLTSYGVSVDFKTYPNMVHSACMQELDDMGDFLETVLPKEQS